MKKVKGERNLSLEELKIGDVVKVVTSDYVKCKGCIKIVSDVKYPSNRGSPINLRGIPLKCTNRGMSGEDEEEDCYILQGETLTNILTDKEIVEVLTWKLTGRK